MAFIALYDACVLHDALLRDLVIRLSLEPVLNLRSRWTETILDEMVHSVLKERPDLEPERLARTREKMCAAVPDCLVTGYEPLLDGLEMPDPNDRHVLAAAIKATAQVIVTYDLDHFPYELLEPFDVEPQHPDEFLVGLLDLNEATVRASFAQQIASLRRAPWTRAQMLERLRRRGLVRSGPRLL
jgi:predicted nucleic acid-binding protein